MVHELTFATGINIHLKEKCKYPVNMIIFGKNSEVSVALQIGLLIIVKIFCIFSSSYGKRPHCSKKPYPIQPSLVPKEKAFPEEAGRFHEIIFITMFSSHCFLFDKCFYLPYRLLFYIHATLSCFLRLELPLCLIEFFTYRRKIKIWKREKSQ